MSLVLITVAFLSVATLLLAAAIWGVRMMLKGSTKGYWRRTLWIVLILMPVHGLVTFPAVIGYWVVHELGTRPDERAYNGPKLGTGGVLRPQPQKSMGTAPPPEDPFDHPQAVRVPGADQLTLRGFLIPATASPPRFQAVLFHGLFRNALELEAVAAWMQEMGGECLLVENRNHGFSDRHPATFGLKESKDVESAVRWIRSRDQAAKERPLILMGISLGTANVMLAAPKIPRLAGLILHAPMDDLGAALVRTVRDRVGLVNPWPSLIRTSMEMWGGFSMDDVRPGDSLEDLAPETAVLLIAEEEDLRMPPETVRNLYGRLPQGDADRRLWVAPGVRHSRAFLDKPKDYRELLSWLVERSLVAPFPR